MFICLDIPFSEGDTPKFFNDEIGAKQYFTGSGVTVSDKDGIGSTEFTFINNDCKFNVEQIDKKYQILSLFPSFPDFLL